MSDLSIWVWLLSSEEKKRPAITNDAPVHHCSFCQMWNSEWICFNSAFTVSNVWEAFISVKLQRAHTYESNIKPQRSLGEQRGSHRLPSKCVGFILQSMLGASSHLPCPQQNCGSLEDHQTLEGFPFSFLCFSTADRNFLILWTVFKLLGCVRVFCVYSLYNVQKWCEWLINMR